MVSTVYSYSGPEDAVPGPGPGALTGLQLTNACEATIRAWLVPTGKHGPVLHVHTESEGCDLGSLGPLLLGIQVCKNSAAIFQVY